MRKVEENVQWFRYEWEKYSQVQWHSEKNKICLQQQTELKSVIDELWELMQIPKQSYNRMKKAVHCGIIWKVKNDEGKDSGVLQHKV